MIYTEIHVETIIIIVSLVYDVFNNKYGVMMCVGCYSHTPSKGELKKMGNKN